MDALRDRVRALRNLVARPATGDAGLVWDERAEALRRIPIFTPLPLPTLALLASRLHDVVLAEGNTLTGDAGASDAADAVVGDRLGSVPPA